MMNCDTGEIVVFPWWKDDFEDCIFFERLEDAIADAYGIELSLAGMDTSKLESDGYDEIEAHDVSGIWYAIDIDLTEEAIDIERE